MIVTVKSSGCLQIYFGPLIIDYIRNFLFDPPNSSYSNLIVLNSSQRGLFRSQRGPLRFLKLQIFADLLTNFNGFEWLFMDTDVHTIFAFSTVMEGGGSINCTITSDSNIKNV